MTPTKEQIEAARQFLVSPENISTPIPELLALYALQHLPRWVPIEEALPEIEENSCTVDVLVAVDGVTLRQPAYLDTKNEKWYFAKTHDRVAGLVTHWQPLPTPPQK